MSCHFISGKPGGGKSMFAMRMLTDEVRRGRRAVVTNLSVKWEGLNHYLHSQGVDLGEEHIRERITIISEEQLREFYLYRGRGVVLGRGRDGVVDYSKCQGGVLFIIDEVHIAFNSRDWGKTGRDVIYYLSQHRKLGDDVVLVSQAVENVDKQMRSMCQDFTYLRNFGKEAMGLFRLPRIFMRQTYLMPAGPNSKAMETHTFRLDVTGLASCYDTAAGVGIVGKTGADSGEQRRGAHWAWAIVGVVALMFCLFKIVPGAIASFFGPRVPLEVKLPVAPPVRVAPPPDKIVPGASQGPTNGPVVAKTPKVMVSGCVVLNGLIRVFLTDGRVLTSERGEVSRVERDYVEAEGQRYWFLSGPVAGRNGGGSYPDGGSSWPLARP